ncbi:MAG: pyruvate kinase [Chloroflexi bacterium]|nr:pyruvate kinase [Chloroflexota bacterium]
MIGTDNVPRRERRTKMVCTLGPATQSPSGIEKLIEAGMDVARLNFSHGTVEEHAASIAAIRSISERLGKPVAVLQDLPGPKIRTGRLAAPYVTLKDGASFTLTTDDIAGDEHRVSVTLPSLPHDVRPGHVIFLDDGALRLHVVSVSGNDVECLVIHGGVLRAEKGINVPGVTLSTPSFTDQDWRFLEFGIEHGVDFVALSFVRSAADVKQVRLFLAQREASIPLIAKIEKHEALDNIDSIIAAVDGIMVARGDLGVEIPIQKVPVAQKNLVRKCNQVGKPVIVATQMLESMIHAPSPTRAEVNDVANAIFDGTDAVMLSGETAIGEYPVDTVNMMAQIALETESALPYERMLAERGANLVPETDDAIAYAACHTAQQLGAAAIIAFTTSGSTARRVAKYRPRAPILALTPSPAVQRRLALSWGVSSFAIGPRNVEDMFDIGSRIGVQVGLASPGELVVITAGLPISTAGATNLLRVARAQA